MSFIIQATSSDGVYSLVAFHCITFTLSEILCFFNIVENKIYIYLYILVVVVEQGLTSHQTHYRSHRGRVLWVKRRRFNFSSAYS